MIILAIESSCDETSVAIVEDGKKVYSNEIFSQIDIHTLYGGVVPEIASRNHIKKITYIIDDAFKKANIKQSDIDYIAVTSTPGLVGSLMVGVNAAKVTARMPMTSSSLSFKIRLKSAFRRRFIAAHLRSSTDSNPQSWSRCS